MILLNLSFIIGPIHYNIKSNNGRLILLNNNQIIYYIECTLVLSLHLSDVNWCLSIGYKIIIKNMHTIMISSCGTIISNIRQI